jgi:hypothetical protein
MISRIPSNLDINKSQSPMNVYIYTCRKDETYTCSGGNESYFKDA